MVKFKSVFKKNNKVSTPQPKFKNVFKEKQKEFQSKIPAKWQSIFKDTRTKQTIIPKSSSKKKSSSSRSSRTPTPPTPTPTTIVKPQLTISPQQQMLQQQTLTQQQKQLIANRQKQAEQNRVKGFSFDVRGTQNIKRGVKGEKLINTGFGPMVRTNKGEIRQLTQKEKKELEPQQTTSLNPLNVITGFFGLSKGIADFSTATNKKQIIAAAGKEVVTNPKGVLTETLKSILLNPGGAIGESVGGGAVFKVAKTTLKPLNQVKKVNIDTKKVIDKKINELEKEVSAARSKGSKDFRLKQKELNILKQERKIIDSDLKDLDKAIKSLNPASKGKKITKKQLDGIEKAGKSFKKRTKKRIKIQEDKKKLLKQFEKERIKQNKPSKNKKSSIQTKGSKISKKDLTQFKKQANSINSRLNKLKDVVKNPATKTKVRDRINKEIDLIQKQLNIIKTELSLDLKLKPSKKKIEILEDYSLLAERVAKLTKKIKNADDIGKIKRPLNLLNKASNFNKLSKAQRKQLISSMDKYIKSSLNTPQKKKPTKTPASTKKIIERNTFTKTQIDNLLKKTDSKDKLNKKLKDIDKRINALKSQKWTASTLKQFNIKKRIAKLEQLKKDVIKNFKESKPLDTKQINLRQELFKNKKPNIKILKNDLKFNQNTIKMNVGSYNIEVIFTRPRGNFKSSKKGRLQNPIQIKIIPRNKKTFNPVVKDMFEKTIKQAYNKPQLRKNMQLQNRINQLNSKAKLLNKSKTNTMQKAKLRILNKQIQQTQNKLKTLNASYSKLFLAQALGLQIKLDLKILNQLQLKQTQALDNINKQINILDTKTPTPPPPKPPGPKPPKPPGPKPPKPPGPKPPKPPGPKPPKPPKPPGPKPPKPPRKPKILKLPKISFDSDKLNNRVAIFEGVYRERKNIRKPFNKKTNPVVTKKINLKTTKNRLLKQLSTKVDNKAIRSMQIKVKGVTNLKKKDITRPSLKKFRLKKGKNSKVLKLVEKSKYTLDSPGEKRELRSLKRVKKKSKKKK